MAVDIEADKENALPALAPAPLPKLPIGVKRRSPMKPPVQAQSAGDVLTTAAALGIKVWDLKSRSRSRP